MPNEIRFFKKVEHFVKGDKKYFFFLKKSA